MRTKQIFLSLVAVFFLSCTSVFAQQYNRRQNQKLTQEERIELRVKRMQERLVLDDKTAAEFAPLYKEYMQALMECHPTVCTTKKCNELTDAERLKRMDDRFNCRQKMLDTQKKYYQKFKKVLNARQLEELFCTHRNSKRGYHSRHHAQPGCNAYPNTSCGRTERQPVRAICPARPTQTK